MYAHDLLVHTIPSLCYPSLSRSLPRTQHLISRVGSRHKRLDAGADDYLTKPFRGDELKARLRTGRRILALQEQLISANEALEFQVAHDALTGVLSRAAITERLRIELMRSQREKTQLGILMIDLDHFKHINDT